VNRAEREAFAKRLDDPEPFTEQERAEAQAALLADRQARQAALPLGERCPPE